MACTKLLHSKSIPWWPFTRLLHLLARVVHESPRWPRTVVWSEPETGHISGGWPGERAPGDTTATHYPNPARSTALERCHGTVTSLPCKIYPHSLNCAVLTRGSGDEFPTISVCKLFESNGLQQDFIYGALTCQAEPPIRHFSQATILRLGIYYSWEHARGTLRPSCRANRWNRMAMVLSYNSNRGDRGSKKLTPGFVFRNHAGKNGTRMGTGCALTRSGGM